METDDETALFALRDAWLESKLRLDILKKEEVNLRKELYARAFPNNKERIVKNETIGIKARVPVTFTLDQAAYEEMLPVLRDKGIPDDLVLYVPRIQKRNLDKLSFSKQTALTGIIEEKEGLVVLEVI